MLSFLIVINLSRSSTFDLSFCSFFLPNLPARSFYPPPSSRLQVTRVHNVDTAGYYRLRIHILVDTILAALAAHS